MSEKKAHTKAIKKSTLVIIIVSVILVIALFVTGLVIINNKDNSNNSSVTSETVSIGNSSIVASEVSNEPSRPEKTVEVYEFKNRFNVPSVKRDVFNDVKNGNKLPYCLYVPEDYSASQKYPVILFLHGAGEMGTDNVIQTNNIKKMFECNGDFIAKAILVCPQTPEWWELDRNSPGDGGGTLTSALHLLQVIQNKYSCDSNRIYVTGLSMGGFATWDLIERHGNIFAAAVPVCGSGNPYNGEAFVNIPIKIYHGTDDPTVSFSRSKDMFDAIRQAGGEKVDFIELQGVEHNAWDPAYSDRHMFSWMFAQNKATNQSLEYEYVSYFQVKDSKGNIIISDEDILDITYHREKNKNDMMAIDFELSASGRSELKRAYQSSDGSLFTVYCLGEKLYTFTATEPPIDNIFSVTDVFNLENYFSFFNVIQRAKNN